MENYKKCMMMVIMFLGLASCGGGTSSTVATTPNNGGNTPVLGGNQSVVQLAGVVVVPNLGAVQNATVTITDLVTNKVLGSSNVQKANGSYTVQTKKTINPVIVSVKGGQYLDESTGSNKLTPIAGITACLPSFPTQPIAVTPITEIATQAILKQVVSTASVIDAANKNVGSALLGGADPTTTIPVDISKATPATATQAEKNYARLLAGLADSAKNAGVDLYTAAKNLSNALFDPYGAPVLSTGALPAEVTNLQVAVKNYTAKGTILTSNIPASDPYVVIGTVNPAVTTAPTFEYYYMEISMDPYIAGQGQFSQSFMELGYETVTKATGKGVWGAFAANRNGVPEVMLASGVNHIVTMDAYGQMLWNNPQFPNLTPVTIQFSKDGEFGIGGNIGVTGAKEVRLDFVVKKPLKVPTIASVKGVYHIVLMGHDSSAAPTAMPGYTESGTLTLDGAGNTSYVATGTGIGTGVPVYTPIKGVSKYGVDPYGVVLNINKGSNGHLILSANGQYGLYELHGAGTQEWGIVIKDHKKSIPFSAMIKAIIYDVHAQGTQMGVNFHKGLNIAKVTPSAVAKANIDWFSFKAFAPVQLSPAIMCGTANTAPCTRNIPIKFYPITPNTTQAAVNGAYEVMDVNALGTPGLANFKSYISSDGGVFWTDDGEAASIVIGLGR